LRANEIPHIDGTVRDCYMVIGWLGRLELLFNAKGLTVDAEKIKVAGVGITDLQWAEWYRLNYESLQNLTWSEFCGGVKEKFLQPNWEADVLRDIRTLRMGEKETFDNFSERALRLQSVIKHKVGDKQLAIHIMAGLPQALELEIRDTGVMDTEPVVLSMLIHIGKRKHEQLIELKREFQPTVGPATQVLNAPPAFPSEIEQKNYNIWRFKCYFAEQGICRWCKTKCGSEPTRCQKPRSSVIIRCPWEYKLPPMP
ncbi:hypothetical protein CROQUDRAFT_16682, partial [Cronartium quercuum f. sp. fusiforme G11]